MLQLDSKPAPEMTIDGRANSDTTAWYYLNEEAIAIPRQRNKTGRLELDRRRREVSG
ncbi:hypothetical protein I6F30_12540 [Bradyrhizobium sp. NBAIM20]|uniref:Uncharacterized protein n=1 Tax=Bradyrhizobium yuanmingense TaxID=108015 RepID=A0ABV4GQ80_9BRAD|nr:MULTISPECIES: hypothetical protein [unclassified Bradyrhizobium]MCA1411955.1 hypothetical protein [Bradyrhizobium sp. NBAIM20]MCA1460813.1 hypothetical protein [Bradyrhizobium sp. NBAIM18]